MPITQLHHPKQMSRLMFEGDGYRVPCGRGVKRLCSACRRSWVPVFFGSGTEEVFCVRATKFYYMRAPCTGTRKVAGAVKARSAIIHFYRLTSGRESDGSGYYRYSVRL